MVFKLPKISDNAALALGGALGVGVAMYENVANDLLPTGVIRSGSHQVLTRGIPMSGQVVSFTSISGSTFFDVGGNQFQQTYAHSYDQDVVTRFDSIAQKLKDLGVDLESEKAKELYEIMKTMPIDELKANIKAMELTKDWLEPEEWKELKEKHQVTVVSKKYAKYGRTYVVYENGNQRVAVFENGKKVMDLCGVVYGDPTKPGKSFAHGDKLMTKVMSLKANEEYYLSHSNGFPVGDYETHRGEPLANRGHTYRYNPERQPPRRNGIFRRRNGIFRRLRGG